MLLTFNESCCRSAAHSCGACLKVLGDDIKAGGKKP